MAVLPANCKHITHSLQGGIPNLGEDALFCETDKTSVGDLLGSHRKPLTNTVWQGQDS